MASVLYLQLDGYPKLQTEGHYRYLFDTVLAGINREIIRHSPTLKLSWGDGVAAVFDNHYEAAKCALDLRDFFRNTNWRPMGFKLEPRVALHVGSIFQGKDPVLERDVMAGAAVDLVKRINTVTPPGEVYVSEALSTLLRSTLKDEDDNTIVVAPVGEVRRARQLGTGELWRLQRSSDSGALESGSSDALKAVDIALKGMSMDIGATSGSIRLLDPSSNGKYTVFACAFGPGSEKIKDDRLPADKGIAASVIKLRRSRISDHLGADSNFDPRTAAKAAIPATNMMTVPIFARDQVLGVVQLVNKAGGFTPDDQGRVEEFARVHAPVLEEVGERLADDDRRAEYFEGLRECTVLFTDLTHSGLLIERFESRGELDIYTQLLDEYVQRMEKLAQEHQCWVNKFMGDGVMILANAPSEINDYAGVAVRLALAITRETRELLASWERLAIPVNEARSRIGLATGRVQLKTLGAGEIRGYTAIGPAVNRAWELLGLGDRDNDSVTLCERTHELCGGHVPELQAAERIEIESASGSPSPGIAYRLGAAPTAPTVFGSQQTRATRRGSRTSRRSPAP